MPRGIYIRTKENRQKLSKAMMNRSVSLRTRKKIGNSNKKALKSYFKNHFAWNKGKPGLKGELHGMWRGGKFINKGYVFIHKPGHHRADVSGYVREHILVMENYLGRVLALGEVIHHKNRIKDDNRIENLMLFSSHSE